MDSNLDIRFEKMEKMAVENAKNDLKQIKEENDKISSERVLELTEEYQKYLAEKYEEDLKKIDRDYNKEIYNFEMDEKVKLNVFKENLLNSIKSKVINEIKQFVYSNEYEGYLYKNIEIAVNTINSNNTTVYLISKDFENYGRIIESKFNVAIDKLDEKYIGGSIVVNKEEKVSIDNTLLTNIEEEIKKINL